MTRVKSPVQSAPEHQSQFAIRAGQLSQRDYYEVLGLSRSASADEIRKAYKTLARKHHPDANADDPDAQRRFAEITEAHEVLGDSEKRKKYDKFGHNWSRVVETPGGGSPFQGFGGSDFGGGGHGSGSHSVEDLLGGMFGGGSPFGKQARGAHTRGKTPPPRPRKGGDIRTKIQVPFQIAVDGGEHEIVITAGSRTERLRFQIPPGIESGKTIRLKGQGRTGPPGTPPGDVLVTVEIAAHPYFRRDGFNLILNVPVTMAEAALGAKIEVPTLTEGNVILSVPEGTSGGSKLRLRGKGIMNWPSGQRGDQIIVVSIVTPKNLTDDARDALRALQKAAPQYPRASLWS